MPDTPTEPTLATQPKRDDIAFVLMAEGLAIAGQLTVQMLECPLLGAKGK